jgi:hypothetical protein
MDYMELLSEVKDAITVKRVYGDPIEKDGMTVKTKRVKLKS